MKTFSKTIEVETNSRNCFVDITNRVKKVCDESKISNGIMVIFIPHTTCGVIVNEDYDPTVQKDIQNTLSSIAPEGKNYLHTEGNADSHIKTAIIGNSVTIPINDSKIALGTWQGIFLAEFDGPRSRKVIVKIIGE